MWNIPQDCTPHEASAFHQRDPSRRTCRTGFSREETSLDAMRFAVSPPTLSRLKPVLQLPAFVRLGRVARTQL